MPSRDWSKAPDNMRDNDTSLLSQAESRAHDMGPGSLPSYSSPNHDSNKSPPESRDKIRCLDGLRGIACLLVFNYHFFWPWTSSIMLGYGAFPPRAPEPYYGLHMLPIVCLLIRGRPMVAIFFAISGYVLCRHILRAIHDRRYEAAYQKLASAAFRRTFRLYIPPSLSMLLVAVLAQVGVFKSETAIYKGPDSAYINGTVTVALAPNKNHHCYNKTTLAVGVEGIAEHLHLMDAITLNMTGAAVQDELFCLNTTSMLIGPDKTYFISDEWDEKHPKKAGNATTTSITVAPTKPTAKPSNDAKEDSMKKDPKAKPKRAAAVTVDAKKTDSKKADLKKEDAKTASGKKNSKAADPKKALAPPAKKKQPDRDLKWIRYGGSWEEHPLIHDNVTYAAQNFTRTYAEWANPFNFGHYHPRYDPHTFTIPKELRGSFLLYLFLLSTAALKARWRLSLGGLLSVYSLIMGQWDMATFLGGTVLSEMDIRRSDSGTHHRRHHQPQHRGGYLHDKVFPASAGRFQPSPRKARLLRWLTVFVALYLLSYPDAAAEYTPGYVLLSKLIPKYYVKLAGWEFYHAVGATLLLPCILHSSLLRGLLEGRTAQYMGKISFSFYLMHGPVLHSLGFWIMPRLFDHFGRPVAFAIGWAVCLTVSLYLSRWWYHKVDVWSVAVGKRVEQMAVDRP